MATRDVLSSSKSALACATIYHDEMHSRLYDFFIGMTPDYLRSGFVYRDNLSALSFSEK